MPHALQVAEIVDLKIARVAIMGRCQLMPVVFIPVCKETDNRLGGKLLGDRGGETLESI